MIENKVLLFIDLLLIQNENGKKMRSQWDSNPRPLDPESNAISTPLCDRSVSSPFEKTI